jgi:hypothetical protein
MLRKTAAPPMKSQLTFFVTVGPFINDLYNFYLTRGNTKAAFKAILLSQ